MIDFQAIPRRFFRTFSALRVHDYAVGLALGLAANAASASILAPKVCTVFRQVAGNDLYSILAGVGGAALLAANMMDEGNNKLKSGALRIGLVTAAVINLESITTIVTGQPWGC